MTARHEVGTIADLPRDGDRIFVEVDEVEIAVFRIDGEYHAIANYCPHQGGPLCEGELTGHGTVDDDWQWTYDEDERNVRCPWHGWVFDVTSGRSVDSERYRTPTYEVDVEDDTLYLVR